MNKWYLALIVLFMVAIGFAFQLPPSVTIHVGSLGDRLFLQSSAGLGEAEASLWYGDEISQTAVSGRSRWTRKIATVHVPAFETTTDTSLMLRLAGWPSNVKHVTLKQPKVTIKIHGQPITSFTPTVDFADYYVVLPPTKEFDTGLQLVIESSDVFIETTTGYDIRPKGVRIERIAIATTNDSLVWRTPPWQLIGNGLLFAMLVFLWVRLSFQRPTIAFGVSAMACAVVACALAIQRIYVVVLLPYLISLLCLAICWQLRSVFIQLVVALRKAFGRGASIGVGLVVSFAAMIAVVIQSSAMPVWFDHPFWLFTVIWIVVGLLVWSGLIQPLAGVVAWLDNRWRMRGEWLFGLLLLGILILAIWIIQTAPFIGHADYADNAVVARNLLRGRGWVVDYVTQFYRIYPSLTHPQETWPLLQPVWIAGVFLIVGVNDIAARIPNIIFLLLALVLIWRMSLLVWDKRVGLIAVILAAGNIFIYRQMVYATSDLAFLAFHFAAMCALFRLRLPLELQPNMRWWHARVARVAGAGVWTGLMLLQKPGSGGMSAIGFGIWLLYEYRSTFIQPLLTRNLVQLRANVRRYAAGLWPVILWAIVAVLCVSPYAVRNIRLFGSAGYSTEQTDTWLLEYTNWDAIYRVYAADGGIGSGDVPDRSWLLRWGFDGVALKLGHQVGAIRDYVMPSFSYLPVNFHLFGAAENATGLLSEMALWFMLLGIVIWQDRLNGTLRRLLCIGFVPYIVFMVVFWHALLQG
ncbi:MAG: glycosyltransferase family 39 protein [Chloroflexales bacterium]|nr:glycosyltransferase family 39 protein [Chloroflexales bacterium]